MQKRLFIESLILFQILTFGCTLRAETLLKKAESESSDVPITITSQKVDFDNQKREAIYSGEVKVVKGEMTLRADRLKVLFRELDQGVKFIQASGHVKTWWKDRYAEAEEGLYDDLAQTIVLTGSPKTWQDENMLKGEKIIYDLAQDKVLVEGGVETILQVESGLLENEPD